MNEELLIPESQSFAYPPVPSRRQDVVRQTLEVAFRHRRMVLGFLALATLAAIAAAIWLPSYQSTMKILVKHERVDPVVTPDNVMQTAVTEVTEQDINS